MSKCEFLLGWGDCKKSMKPCPYIDKMAEDESPKRVFDPKDKKVFDTTGASLKEWTTKNF